MVRSTNNVWLHRYACGLALATLFLVALGGVVTTKGVGMAVPDWPTTYGENMFLFHYSKWVGGVFEEHTHRLVASMVGMLTAILAVWLWARDSRRWLRWLGAAAFFGVVFQGVLGGFRVIYNQHGWGTEFGVFHALVAQLFFLLVCSIALFTSRWWSEQAGWQIGPAGAVIVRRFFAAATVLILLQLIQGAAMRHQHAGLAVPDFPLAYGKLWPATDAHSVELYNATRLEAAGESAITAPHIVVHMLHRFTGFAILLAILAASAAARRNTARGSWLRKTSGLWVAVAFLQVALGIFTIWSQRKVDVTTAHVALGAVTLIIGWMLVLVSSRCVAPKTISVSEGERVMRCPPELEHA